MGCYELNCIPPKRGAEVLTSNTCESDLIWKLIIKAQK